MKIKHNMYTLGKSSILKLLEKNDEIQLDVTLEKIVRGTYSHTGRYISGVITDINTKPISKAIIKLMDGNLTSLLNTVSDSSGNYFFDNIPKKDSYIISAIAPNKLLNQTEKIILQGTESKAINFVLKDNLSISLGSIHGSINDENSIPTSISGAVISLYSIKNGSSLLTAITYSDISGNFIFNELKPGDYAITISALGYISSKSTITVKSNNISNLTLSLAMDNLKSKGIISGSILDLDNLPISNADVILYNVENGNNITPVSFTKTNSYGFYSFINVPEGTFLVKSKQSHLITVTVPPTTTEISPITSPSYTIPIVTPPLSNSLPTNIKYNLAIDSFSLNEDLSFYYKLFNIAKDGILSNNATTDSSKNLVKNIGGPNDGKATLIFNINYSGNYILSISYLSGDKARCLNIDVNNASPSTYCFPKTIDWSLANIRTFTIPVFLNKGSNKIVFHGDKVNFSPNLITCIVSKNPEIFAIEAKDTIIENNATFNKTTNFINNIGGPNNGSCKFYVNMSTSTHCALTINYLSGDKNRPLKININNDDEIVSTVNKTTDWFTNNSANFTTPITLNSGLNTIKITGDGANSGPSIGKCTISEIPFSSIILAKDCTLYDNASIKNNTIIGIGETLPASTTFTVNTPKEGIYILKIYYICINKTTLKININNVNIPPIPSLPLSASSDSLQSIDIKIKLNAGKNLIKVY